MYLKKIEIFGFKSFADRTTISFEHGITAIVGPNGCGKSNISDSIRWVLGEKSAKTLRGGKMEDLIFAGTQQRKQLGFAEVSLTISNEDKLFPLDYEEVLLTRRLYRSGESEYSLNKTPCRLKDIQDLLMNTGIGSNAYSMVEQGQIDYIVQAKANERRFLIEEAAGISKYKNKKEEALRKLERTEKNLQRVNDIIAEIEKNIKYAERQAKRAEKYRRQFDELKNLELIHADVRFSAMKNELSALSQEKHYASVRAEELHVQLSEFHARLQGLDEQLHMYESEQQDLDEKRFAFRSELTTLQDKKNFNDQKIVALNERNDLLDEEISQGVEKIASLQEDIVRQKQMLEQFYIEAQSDRDALAGLVSRRAQISAELEQKKKLVELCALEEMDVSSRIAKVRNEMHANKNQHVGLINKREGVEKSLVRLADEEDEILRKIELSRDEVSSIMSDYTSSKASLDNLVRDADRVKHESIQIQEQLLQKRGLLQAIDSKLKALEELAASLSAFKEGTKSLIEESRSEDSPHPSSFSTVLDVIDVHEGFQHAIQAVLAECLYSIIADTYDDALGIMRYAGDQNKGSVDVFINDSGLENDVLPAIAQNENVLTRASDVIVLHDERYSGIRNFLRRVLVVSDIHAFSREAMAAIIKDYHIVSKKGDVLTRDGLFKRRAEHEFLAGALVQEERRHKLSAEKSAVQEEIVRLNEELQRLKGVLTGLEERRESVAEEVVQRKITLESNEKMTSSIKENLAKIQEHKNVLEYDLSLFSEELAGVAERQVSLDAHLAEQEALLAEKEITHARARDEHAHGEQVRGEIQLEIASRETTCNALNEKENFLKQTLSIVTENYQNEVKLKDRNQTEKEANDEKSLSLEDDNERMNDRLFECVAEVESLEKTSEVVRSKRASVSAERDQAMQSLEGLNKEHEAKKDALHAMHVKEVELQYQESAIKERLQQVYKLDIEGFDFSTLDREGVDIELIDENIATLQKKVESLGTVNLLAGEEYQELKDRYTFIMEQHADLENARASLMEAIRKINKTTRQLFLDVFAQVQKNFSSYYRILFNGGVGELVLIDPENPLESGIDIMVQPPGKKLQNISLLSGGEKALTAVALIFSLFKVKPSPFCVLDEVDAPLDEANIDRFLSVLNEFADSTQFIIVTHNRKTVAIADTLFGVTMEDAGVSKIVSVRVRDVALKEDEAKDGETHNFNKKQDNVDQIIDDIFKEV